jgi:hypothetical protein
MEGLRLASTADPKGFPPSSPPAMRGNHVGVHVRSNDTSAAQFLVMRGPHGCHLFASLEWPRQTRCSLEAIDIKYTIGFFAGDTVGLDPAVASKARKGDFVRCLDHFELLQSPIN